MELERAQVTGPLDLGEVRFLTSDVVIGIHVVHSDDVVALRQQGICDMTSDEPGRAC
jgi:hypothetical protein